MSVSVYLNGGGDTPTSIYTRFSLLNVFQFIISLKAFPIINKFLKDLSYLFSPFIFFFFLLLHTEHNSDP